MFRFRLYTILIISIQVCFVGEPAIDTGGPSREFWSLLVKCINDNLCTGKDGNKVFFHDVSALQV